MCHSKTTFSFSLAVGRGDSACNSLVSSVSFCESSASLPWCPVVAKTTICQKLTNQFTVYTLLFTVYFYKFSIFLHKTKVVFSTACLYLQLNYVAHLRPIVTLWSCYRTISSVYSTNLLTGEEIKQMNSLSSDWDTKYVCICVCLWELAYILVHNRGLLEWDTYTDLLSLMQVLPSWTFFSILLSTLFILLLQLFISQPLHLLLLPLFLLLFHYSLKLPYTQAHTHKYTLIQFFLNGQRYSHYL